MNASDAAPSAAPSAATDRRRYPGIRSFEEPDRGRFFGRRLAAEELLLRVLSVRLLLQFAPSGAGKTSLLNAGLFPRLRPHGYVPVMVRLNNPDESVAAAAARSLRLAAQETGLRAPVVPANPASLWDLVVGTQLWSADLLLLTPVLVFDQFEEVFTLRDEAFRRQFAHDVGELTRGRHAAATPAATEPALPEVKVVISLREEYLGALEEMTAAIPDLFRERLRVPPLNHDEAREAIVEPAALAGEWSSPAFTYDPPCLEAMIDFIDGVSERVRVIEPLTLQLICQRAEAIVTERSRRDDLPVVKLSDFGGPAGFEQVVHRYFKDELDKIADGGARRRAVELFETGLLDPAGKRLMLEEGEITRTFGVEPDTLAQLVVSRLLRREPRNESVFYEISHDRLTEAIARNRRHRLPRWVRPTLAIAVLFILVLLGGLYMINQQRREAIAAKQQASEALQLLLGDELAGRLREVGLSDAVKQALDNVAVDPADARVLALLRRRLGELAWERDTLMASETAFREALAALDALEADAVTPIVFAERGTALRALGDIEAERGKVSEAEGFYTRSVEAWTEAAKRGLPSPESRLSAAETRLAVATLKSRLGDLAGAETELIDVARRARELMLASYVQSEEGTATDSFALGRALQVFAEATLNLARASWQLDELRGARALAAELVRIRPMSAQARVQLGAASAIYGAATLDRDNVDEARRLFDESGRQFADLTQSDPSNRRMMRERSAVRLLTIESLARCAQRATCRGKLRPGELSSAHADSMESIAQFERVASGDADNRALMVDRAWGLETQATAAVVRGDSAQAPHFLDQALELRRAALVDPRDSESREAIVDVLYAKADALTTGGQRDAALAAVEQGLAETAQLPAGLTRLFRRVTGLRSKADLLKKSRRPADADALAAEIAEIDAALAAETESRGTRARQFNQAANTTFARAMTLTGAPARQAYDAATADYWRSLDQEPGDPIVWTNLKSSCAGVSGTFGGVATPPPADAAARERALECVLQASWLGWVLTEDVTSGGASSAPPPGAADRREALRALYEARRGLALHLRDSDSKRALSLAEHGARDVEAYAKRQARPDAHAMFLLADAHFGVAMLRQDSEATGWEPSFRTAVAYGEQVLALENRVAERYRWLGMVRGELANRFDAAGRRDEAEAERVTARAECGEALRLARDEDDRAAARTCTEAATPQPEPAPASTSSPDTRR